jgi:hypothetical protein
MCFLQFLQHTEMKAKKYARPMAEALKRIKMKKLAEA